MKKIILIGTGTNTNQIIDEIEKYKNLKIEDSFFLKKNLRKNSRIVKFLVN